MSQKQAIAAAIRPVLESLEQRQLLTTVTLVGTEDPDSYSVSRNATTNSLDFKVNGALLQSTSASQVTRVVIQDAGDATDVGNTLAIDSPGAAFALEIQNNDRLVVDVTRGGVTFDTDEALASLSVSANAAATLAGSGLHASGSVSVGGQFMHTSGVLDTPYLVIEESGSLLDQGGSIAHTGGLNIDNSGTFKAAFAGSLSGTAGTWTSDGHFIVDVGAGNTSTIGMTFVNAGGSSFNLLSGTAHLTAAINTSSDLQIDGTAGTLRVPAYTTPSGKVTLNGGTLKVDSDLAVGGNNATTASLKVQGGTLNVGGLVVGSSSAAVLTQSGGAIVAANANIGVSGLGISWTMTGGTATFGGLAFAYWGTGTNTLNLSGGSLTVNGGLGVGYGTTATVNISAAGALTSQWSTYGAWYGTSTVNQSGGSHNAGEINLGAAYGSTSTYNLSGGTLDTGGLYLTKNADFPGDTIQASFHQTGGVHHVGWLYLGNAPHGKAEYRLDGGQLYATWFLEGSAGDTDVNFTQTAGQSVFDRFYLGDAGSGMSRFTLSGGSTSVLWNAYVGFNAKARLDVSGGTFTNASTLVVSGDGADRHNPNGHGTVNLSGTGQITATHTVIGYGSDGTFVQYGGTFSTGYLILGAPSGSQGVFTPLGGIATYVSYVDVLEPTVSGDAVVDEGTPYRLDLSATRDVGNNAIYAWGVDWDDYENVSQYVSGYPTYVNHTYRDGDNRYTIQASASGGDQAYTAPPVDVFVKNVPATIAELPAVSATAGISFTLTGAFSDLGKDDTHTVLIHWDDGTISKSQGPSPAVTVSESQGAGTISAAHAFWSSGTHTATIFVTDSDGATSQRTVTINVAYAAPTYAISATPNPAAKGQATTLNMTATGPNAGDVTEWRVDWGDGTPVQVYDDAPTSTAAHVFDWVQTHVYAQQGTYTIHAVAVDGAGAHSVPTQTLTVLDPTPIIQTPASSDSTIVQGTTVGLSVLGNDDGGEANLHYTWSLVGQPASAVSYLVNGNNAAKNTTVTFGREGTYRFRVTVSDGELIATSEVTVYVETSLNSIEINPNDSTIDPGASIELHAVGYDQFGEPLDEQPAWEWGSQGDGSVDANGVYTADGDGTGAMVYATDPTTQLMGMTYVRVQDYDLPSVSGLSAVSVSARHVRLNWTAPSGFDHYILQRSTSSTFSSVETFTFGAGRTTFNDTTVAPSTQYYYRLATADAAGHGSAFSTAVNATTPQDLALTDLQAVATSLTSVQVAWAGQGTGLQYQLERSESEYFSNATTLATTGQSYTDTTVSADHTYYYRLLTSSDGGTTWNDAGLRAIVVLTSAANNPADNTSAGQGFATNAIEPSVAYSAELAESYFAGGPVAGGTFGTYGGRFSLFHGYTSSYSELHGNYATQTKNWSADGGNYSLSTQGLTSHTIHIVDDGSGDWRYSENYLTKYLVSQTFMVGAALAWTRTQGGIDKYGLTGSGSTAGSTFNATEARNDSYDVSANPAATGGKQVHETANGMQKFTFAAEGEATPSSSGTETDETITYLADGSASTGKSSNSLPQSTKDGKTHRWTYSVDDTQNQPASGSRTGETKFAYAATDQLESTDRKSLSLDNSSGGTSTLGTEHTKLATSGLTQYSIGGTRTNVGSKWAATTNFAYADRVNDRIDTNRDQVKATDATPEPGISTHTDSHETVISSGVNEYTQKNAGSATFVDNELTSFTGTTTGTNSSDDHWTVTGDLTTTGLDASVQDSTVTSKSTRLTHDMGDGHYKINATGGLTVNQFGHHARTGSTTTTYSETGTGSWQNRDSDNVDTAIGGGGNASTRNGTDESTDVGSQTYKSSATGKKSYKEDGSTTYTGSSDYDVNAHGTTTEKHNYTTTSLSTTGSGSNMATVKSLGTYSNTADGNYTNTTSGTGIYGGTTSITHDEESTDSSGRTTSNVAELTANEVLTDSGSQSSKSTTTNQNTNRQTGTYSDKGKYTNDDVNGVVSTTTNETGASTGATRSHVETKSTAEGNQSTNNSKSHSTATQNYTRDGKGSFDESRISATTGNGSVTLTRNNSNSFHELGDFAESGDSTSKATTTESVSQYVNLTTENQTSKFAGKGTYDNANSDTLVSGPDGTTTTSSRTTKSDSDGNSIETTTIAKKVDGDDVSQSGIKRSIHSKYDSTETDTGTYKHHYSSSDTGANEDGKATSTATVSDAREDKGTSKWTSTDVEPITTDDKSKDKFTRDAYDNSVDTEGGSGKYETKSTFSSLNEDGVASSETTELLDASGDYTADVTRNGNAKLVDNSKVGLTNTKTSDYTSHDFGTGTYTKTAGSESKSSPSGTQSSSYSDYKADQNGTSTSTSNSNRTAIDRRVEGPSTNQTTYKMDSVVEQKQTANGSYVAKQHVHTDTVNGNTTDTAEDYRWDGGSGTDKITSTSKGSVSEYISNDGHGNSISRKVEPDYAYDYKADNHFQREQEASTVKYNSQLTASLNESNSDEDGTYTEKTVSKSKGKHNTLNADATQIDGGSDNGSQVTNAADGKYVDHVDSSTKWSDTAGSSSSSLETHTDETKYVYDHTGDTTSWSNYDSEGLEPLPPDVDPEPYATNDVTTDRKLVEHIEGTKIEGTSRTESDDGNNHTFNTTSNINDTGKSNFNNRIATTVDKTDFTDKYRSVTYDATSLELREGTGTFEDASHESVTDGKTESWATSKVNSKGSFSLETAANSYTDYKGTNQQGGNVTKSGERHDKSSVTDGKFTADHVSSVSEGVGGSKSSVVDTDTSSGKTTASSETSSEGHENIPGDAYANTVLTTTTSSKDSSSGTFSEKKTLSDVNGVHTDASKYTENSKANWSSNVNQQSDSTSSTGGPVSGKGSHVITDIGSGTSDEIYDWTVTTTGGQTSYSGSKTTDVNGSGHTSDVKTATTSGTTTTGNTNNGDYHERTVSTEHKDDVQTDYDTKSHTGSTANGGNTTTPLGTVVKHTNVTTITDDSRKTETTDKTGLFPGTKTTSINSLELGQKGTKKVDTTATTTTAPNGKETTIVVESGSLENEDRRVATQTNDHEYDYYDSYYGPNFRVTGTDHTTSTQISKRTQGSSVDKNGTVTNFRSRNEDVITSSDADLLYFYDDPNNSQYDQTYTVVRTGFYSDSLESKREESNGNLTLHGTRVEEKGNTLDETFVGPEDSSFYGYGTKLPDGHIAEYHWDRHEKTTRNEDGNGTTTATVAIVTEEQENSNADYTDSYGGQLASSDWKYDGSSTSSVDLTSLNTIIGTLFGPVTKLLGTYPSTLQSKTGTGEGNVSYTQSRYGSTYSSDTNTKINESLSGGIVTKTTTRTYSNSPTTTSTDTYAGSGEGLQLVGSWTQEEVGQLVNIANDFIVNLGDTAQQAWDAARGYASNPGAAVDNAVAAVYNSEAVQTFVDGLAGWADGTVRTLNPLDEWLHVPEIGPQFGHTDAYAYGQIAGAVSGVAISLLTGYAGAGGLVGCGSVLAKAAKGYSLLSVGAGAIGATQHYIEGKAGWGDALAFLPVLGWGVGKLAGAACFVGDTAVVSATSLDGGLPSFRPQLIEDIRVGDQIVTRDQLSDDSSLQIGTVTRIFQHVVYQLLDVTIRNADGSTSVIQTTSNHPYYVEGRGWTPAGRMQRGDIVAGTDSADTVVVDIVQRDVPLGVTVYNLEVEGTHTYFVDGGPDDVWVHNECAGLNHFFPRSLGSTVRYGDSLLTDMTAKQHTAFHVALRKFLANTNVRGVGGKLVNLLPKAGHGGARIRAEVDAATRISVMKKFYNSPAGARWKTKGIKEIEETVKRGMFV